MAPTLFDATTDAITVDLNSLWLLVAAALVLLMTPGVAFFYGGMVRAKSVISMMMMSFGAIALVAVLWVLYGFSMAFPSSTPDSANAWVIHGVIGNPFADGGLIPLLTKGGAGAANNLNTLAFAGFQATFAIITVALISGAIADRARFGTWMVFAGLWVTLVYFPVASWVFDFTAGNADGGFIVHDLLVNDFAGGTAVHMNAGMAALALALVLGRSAGWPKSEHVRPHSRPLGAHQLGEAEELEGIADQPAADVVAERLGVPVEHPEHADQRQRPEAHHHHVEDALRADHAAVEERQAGCHEQHQGGAGQNPRGVAGVHGNLPFQVVGSAHPRRGRRMAFTVPSSCFAERSAAVSGR